MIGIVIGLILFCWVLVFVGFCRLFGFNKEYEFKVQQDLMFKDATKDDSCVFLLSKNGNLNKDKYFVGRIKCDLVTGKVTLYTINKIYYYINEKFFLKEWILVEK